ncbi:MAG TPA: multifunctional CCA addition/repair protein [Xanthomonadales bacterium]|nr:multifunctional CCA addition/repair protein [Xanthomonadales bacterium]
MSSEAVYLVGGAVRDELLGLEVGERDWVVTGSTPEALLKRGYRQVGASFPVFLHPETAEEYALARTERKQGHGYHGFSVDFHPGVTLEEDLERRDLTINAMARDARGGLIDPFGGQEDLDKRLLRHVSPAFTEDPLRVLRVARFAARFSHLGFLVDAGTLQLMRDITASGELQHLAEERCWSELIGGLSAQTPSVYLDVLRECGALAVLLPEVDRLFGVPQPEQYHPEIDTGVHVQMTLDYAARQGYPAEVRFALLLHDLGKGLTAPEEWPSHHDHEKTGLPLVRDVCARLRAPTAFRDLAVIVSELHVLCHRAEELRPSRLLALLEQADLLRRPERLEPFLQACESDFRGRKGLEQRPYPQTNTVKAALEAVAAVKPASMELEGLSGEQIGLKIREARIEAISHQRR